MTPFGERLRALRARKGVAQKTMATDLGVSAAYLSALEHGRRGRPSPGLVNQICGYFGLIWDDAEALKRLAHMSHPRVVIDTSGLTPQATQLANRLADAIGALDEETLEWLLAEVEGRLAERGRNGQ